MLENKFIECERAYYRNFCETTIDNSVIRFRDPLLKGMYDHNFTEVVDGKVTPEFFQTEIKIRQNEGEKFCKVQTYNGLSADVLEKVDLPKEREYLGFYLMDLNKLSSWKDSPEKIEVKIVKNEMQLQQIIDIELDGETSQEYIDFVPLKEKRRSLVYFADEGIDAFVAYQGNEPTGHIQLFVHNKVAKIEDFKIVESHRGKGLGTTLLKYVMDLALSQGVDSIHLNADEEDTAKEMYMKLGFEKIGQLESVRFTL
ncbi:MAG: GNAT family N-acetyltransferase [Streptococcaceae bacterium]|jgi:spore maturation protein CgeE|nr:GNAT family N-acetyltransferase [Streptococcaceae bacterium]